MPDPKTPPPDAPAKSGGGIDLKVIKSFDQLGKVVPGYGELSIAELLASPAFSGPDAYTIDPYFFKDLQQALLTLEAGYGVPANAIPSGVFADPDRLKGILKEAEKIGRGSGTRYGVSAPDPLGAANVLLNKWAQEIANSEGTFSAEKAFAEFQKDWADLQANYNVSQAGLQSQTDVINAAQNRGEAEDRRLREEAEAQRRLNVAQEATTRARSVATEFLPNMIMGATGMNFPLLGGGTGHAPLYSVNLDQMFNQGGVGNLANLPAISPNPAIPYTSFTTPQLPALPAMPNFPAPPQYPQAPDISALIAAGAAGSPGWA